MTLELIMKFLAMFAAAPVSSVPANHVDNTVVVTFVSDPLVLDERCGPSGPDQIILACTNKIGGHVMTLPNPCIYKDQDPYARVLCHELGHTNEWRHGEP